jgi:hypothetical protein
VLEAVGEAGKLGRKFLLLRQVLRPPIGKQSRWKIGFITITFSRRALACRSSRAIRRACRITMSDRGRPGCAA